MKSIIALVLAASIFHGYNREQTPEQTVKQFRVAQQRVHEAADLATPHIIAVVDQVIKPAIDQVNKDAAASGYVVETDEIAPVRQARYQRVDPGWNVGTEFSYCYVDTTMSNPTPICYGEPVF